MTTPPGRPTGDRIPGERPPADARRRLERAPGERYATPGSPEAPEAPEPSGSFARATLLGGTVAIAGALAITLLVGLLAIDTGLVVVAGLSGLFAGLAVRLGAGGSLGRGERARLAVALALAGVALGLAGSWLYGRYEGGVLGPLDYVVQVFGPLALLLAAVAAVAAWWGSR
jgi:hypothetical protein